MRKKDRERSKAFQKEAKELELQSWLDHQVFDLVKKNLFVDHGS